MFQSIGAFLVEIDLLTFKIMSVATFICLDFPLRPLTPCLQESLRAATLIFSAFCLFHSIVAFKPKEFERRNFVLFLNFLEFFFIVARFSHFLLDSFVPYPCNIKSELNIS